MSCCLKQKGFFLADANSDIFKLYSVSTVSSGPLVPLRRMYALSREMPASLAQLDAQPTGYRVVGLITTGSGNIFLRRLVMNIFYGHSFPSADPGRAVVSFGNREDKPAHEKCGQVNWPAQHDLSSVDCAVKLQTNQLSEQAPLLKLIWFLSKRN